MFRCIGTALHQPVAVAHVKKLEVDVSFLQDGCWGYVVSTQNIGSTVVEMAAGAPKYDRIAEDPDWQAPQPPHIHRRFTCSDCVFADLQRTQRHFVPKAISTSILSTRRKRVRESARNGFACLFACLRFVLVSGAFLLSHLAGYLLSAACLLSSGCPVLAGRP